MKKPFFLFVLASMLTFAFVADAATPSLPSVEPLPGEPDVGSAISPMKKGQVAPYTGVLLSPKALATIVTELKSFDERIKIELERANGESKARCDYEINAVKIAAETDSKVAQARLEENQKRIEILEETIEEQQTSQSDPVLYGGLGFGIGVAATVLLAYATTRVTTSQ